MQFVLKYPSALLLYFWELIIFKLTVGRSWNKGNKLENLFTFVCNIKILQRKHTIWGDAWKKKFLYSNQQALFWKQDTESYKESIKCSLMWRRSHVGRKSVFQKMLSFYLVRSRLTSGNMLSCKNNIHMLFLQQVLLEHDRRSKDSTF